MHRHRQSCDGAAACVEHRGGGAPDIRDRLLPLVGQPVHPDRVQLTAQDFGIGDGARSEWRERGVAQAVELLERPEREQHLPDTRRVRRKTTADPGRQRRHELATEPVDVHDLGALQHGQVNGLLRGGHEFVHVWGGDPSQIRRSARLLAELEQADAEPEVVPVALEQALVDQVACYPRDRCLRDPGAAAELRHRELALLAQVEPEDLGYAADHRRRGRVSLNGTHAQSVEAVMIRRQPPYPIRETRETP